MTKRQTNVGKGIAAILLLFHHLFYTMKVPGQTGESLQLSYWLINEQVLGQLAWLAKICVSFFAFFSGYGTAKSIMERKVELEDPREYITHVSRRFFSLLLSYWFVFLLTLLLAVSITVVASPRMDARPYVIYGELSAESIGYVLLDFMGISSLLSTPTLNPTWWYMSVAFLLILLIPIVYLWCQKTGLISVVLISLGSAFLTFELNAGMYLAVASAGIAAAYYRVFERMASAAAEGTRKKVSALLLWGVAFAASVILRLEFLLDMKLWGIMDTAVIFCTCALITLGLGQIPVLADGLAWIGRHSMNIFMSHTFLYYFWFTGYIYSFRYPVIILGVLLAGSLAFSLGIEFLKKLLRFDKWSRTVTEWLTQWILLPYPEKSTL